MQALLNFTTKILAFGDPQASSNPSLRFIDWTRNVSGVAVNNPKVESHRVDPGATVSVFSGIRTLTIDGTTAFSLALLGLDGARARANALIHEAEAALAPYGTKAQTLIDAARFVIARQS